MKISNDRADAMDLIRDIHKKMKDLQESISELEYLIYETDERCKITFFAERKDERKAEM